MAYTEDDAFADCTKDTKNKTDPRKCKEIWLAFCKWIIEIFEKGRGVSILHFMVLSWIPDIVQAETTIAHRDRKAYRPVWRMAQSFENAFHLSCKNKSDKRAPDDANKFVKVKYLEIFSGK